VIPEANKYNYPMDAEYSIGSQEHYYNKQDKSATCPVINTLQIFKLSVTFGVGPNALSCWLGGRAAYNGQTNNVGLSADTTVVYKFNHYLNNNEET
jgi:hypothetical protein